MSNWTINKARKMDNGYRIELACDFDSDGNPAQVRAFEWPIDSPLLIDVDVEDNSVVIKVLVDDALKQIKTENSVSTTSISEISNEPEDLVAPGTAVSDL